MSSNPTSTAEPNCKMCNNCDVDVEQDRKSGEGSCRQYYCVGVTDEFTREKIEGGKNTKQTLFSWLAINSQNHAWLSVCLLVDATRHKQQSVALGTTVILSICTAVCVWLGRPGLACSCSKQRWVGMGVCL